MFSYIKSYLLVPVTHGEEWEDFFFLQVAIPKPGKLSNMLEMTHLRLVPER
jgi:hypothetical protein